MPPILHRVAARLRRSPPGLAGAAAVVAGLLLVVRVLVHLPFYDETVHAHYLWLLSERLVPGKDFFCYYPVLGYLPFLPYFRLFPESAFTLLALRYASLVVVLSIGLVLAWHGRRTSRSWALAVLPLALLATSRYVGAFLVEFSVDHVAALAAVGAMALFFRAPTDRSVGLASALSLWSVLVMPKYVFALWFGLAGHLVAAWRAGLPLVRLLRAVLSGGAAALTLAVILLRWQGVPPWEALTSLAFNSTHQLHLEKRGLAALVGSTLLAEPVLLGVLALGMAGWARRSWRRTDAHALGGAGLLVGVLAVLALSGNVLEQYQATVYLPLAMFAPFATAAFPGRMRAATVAAVLCGSTLAWTLASVAPLAREFESTSTWRDTRLEHRVPPAFVALGDADELLRIIPRDERVVALWVNHPIFRRDLTEMTADARPSFSTVVDPGGRLAPMFDPARFQEALERSPPALIAPWLLYDCYPPGWLALAMDFLRRNSDRYERFDSRTTGDAYWIRKDLLLDARPRRR